MNSQPTTTANSSLTSLAPDMAVIAMGANLPSPVGEPEATFDHVCDRMALLAAGPVQCSRYYQSEPQDCPPGSPTFLNAVMIVTLAESLAPEELLSRLLDLESELGRQRRGVINAPRSLDLDLIALGDCQQHSEKLTLPHPRAQQRLFVLEPLAELAPGLKLPGWTVSVQALVATLKA